MINNEAIYYHLRDCMRAIEILHQDHQELAGILKEIAMYVKQPEQTSVPVSFKVTVEGNED